LYNFDGISIYEKWMADFRDEQQSNGVIPAIIPSSGWGYHWGNGPDWTSTIAIIPWNIYLFYGDSHLLESCYDNIKRYVDHIDEISPTGLTDWALGDWLPVKSKVSGEYMSSVYFYIDATILNKTAKILGKQADYEKYSALAGKIKSAINGKYFKQETAMYGKGFQTELSAALKWGLVPDGLTVKVAENLSDRVIADNSHIDVGLLGSKTILNALSENGYADLAFKVATQETYPSWGWWIVNGATTFYETWSIDSLIWAASRNHGGFGEINAWFYKALGGIFPDEDHPGFKNIILKPNFVSGLEQFEAKHDGPYGTIVSSWKKYNGEISYEVTIPANSTATLYLKTGKVLENGKDLSENKHIRIGKGSSQLQVISLVAGDYRFSFDESI
jgi:alpha-L-rhamnosidase